MPTRNKRLKGYRYLGMYITKEEAEAEATKRRSEGRKVQIIRLGRAQKEAAPHPLNRLCNYAVYIR